VRAAVPALLTIAIDLVLWRHGADADFSQRTSLILELLCLLVLAIRAIANAWLATACVALLCGALGSIPVASAQLDEGDQSLILTLLTIVAAGFIGFGVYLRTSDSQHRAAVRQVQIGERLAIAADLHDFVAHHVTGILVQTQMARLMAAADAPQLDPVLANVEQAAGEALASMRRLVGVLRTSTGAEADGESDGGAQEEGEGTDGSAAPAVLRPADDLAQLAQTVDTFSRMGPSAVLRMHDSVTEDLPHVIQSAAFRIVQESLTNVRKHAADATEVLVDLQVTDAALVVCVTDDGGGSTLSSATAHNGGFGLVGLRERVAALGGDIKAGPAERGWRVAARLPLARPERRAMNATKTGSSLHA
jgi:signal transduction histidine kinase